MTTTKMKHVDAVVVGSGVVGSIICMELANAGLNVVCLERGRMSDPQKDFTMPYTHDELKYDGLAALTTGIAKDCADAQVWFASRHGETSRQTTRDRI